MPASITLSSLGWSTPDGRPLFSDLNLGFGPECTGIVGRNGTGKTTLLRLIAGDLSPSRGHVSRQAKVAWLRQEASTSTGETIADLFGAGAGLSLIDLAEMGRADADELLTADWTLPGRMETALARCGLTVDPRTRLDMLSGGQRTRAGLAALTFGAPDFLLLDEPTNNLDRDGRRAVLDLVRSWQSGVIMVSHDRELLEAMDAIVEISTLGVARYGGNYSTYLDRRATELAATQRDLSDAEKAMAEARRRAQQAAERKARTDRAGRKLRVKGGQPKILMDAAKARSEASGGANARLRDARNEAATEALSEARRKIEILQPVAMDLPSTGLPVTRTVLRLDGVTGGHDREHPVLRDLSLCISGPERLAITGPNGCGKTTLIDLITGRLAPVAGGIDVKVPLARLDQHVDLLDRHQTLSDNFRHLNPDADINTCRAALARFGFRAGDALRTAATLSGGERLRAALACVLGRPSPPQLLILDEPTNHMDLDAVEALEAALAAFDGALIVVSHDERFLEGLKIDRRLELGDRSAAGQRGVKA